MTEPTASSRGGLGTIRNATKLLSLLAAGPALQHLTDLAERSEMSVPTVHRLLRSLVLADYAVQDPTTLRYGLGPELSRLAAHYRSKHPVMNAVSPFVVALRDQLQATIATSILVGHELVCLDQVDARDRGAFRVPHGAVPALESAAGRLLAARADEATWDMILADAPDETAETARQNKAEWAQAEHLYLPASDMLHAAEAAVLIKDAEGSAVATLSADISADTSTDDVKKIIAVLNRTAISCGGTLRNG